MVPLEPFRFVLVAGLTVGVDQELLDIPVIRRSSPRQSEGANRLGGMAARECRATVGDEWPGTMGVSGNCLGSLDGGSLVVCMVKRSTGSSKMKAGLLSAQICGGRGMIGPTSQRGKQTAKDCTEPVLLPNK